MKKDKLAFLNYNYSLSKMIEIGVILLLIYVCLGFVTLKAAIPKPWNAVLYGIAALAIAACCAHVAHTSKVLNFKIKQEKLKYLTAIFLTILLLIYVAKSVGWILVFKQNLTTIVICVAMALGAGFCEEYTFRNLFFNIFIGAYKNKKYTILWSSVTSSAIFGCMHLVNLTHQGWGATSQQVFYAFCIGLISCVIHIMTNSMIWCAILHFLFDLTPIISTESAGTMPWITVIFMFLPIMIISLTWIWLFNKKVIQAR